MMGVRGMPPPTAADWQALVQVVRELDKSIGDRLKELDERKAAVDEASKALDERRAALDNRAAEIEKNAQETTRRLAAEKRDGDGDISERARKLQRRAEGISRARS